MAGTLLFNALREAIDEEMARDPYVCVMGEDVGHYGGSYKVTKDLCEKYGDLRVLDTPIAENGFTGMAVGAAMTGLRPIVEGMNMGFLLLAFNQISNNLGMLRYTSGGNFTIPTVVRGPGGVGRQLGAEHSQRLEAYFHAVPGIKIVACSTPTNAKGLMRQQSGTTTRFCSSSMCCFTTSARNSLRVSSPVPSIRRIWCRKATT